MASQARPLHPKPSVMLVSMKSAGIGPYWLFVRQRSAQYTSAPIAGQSSGSSVAEQVLPHMHQMRQAQLARALRIAILQRGDQFARLALVDAAALGRGAAALQHAPLALRAHL